MSTNACSSSCKSRSARSRCEHPAHDRHQAMQECHAPSRTLATANETRVQRWSMLFELLAAGGGQPVVLGSPFVLGGAPFGFQLAVLFETVQRREERSWIDLELIAAEHRESLRDAAIRSGATRSDRGGRRARRAGSRRRGRPTIRIAGADAEQLAATAPGGCRSRRVTSSSSSARNGRGLKQPRPGRTDSAMPASAAERTWSPAPRAGTAAGSRAAARRAPCGRRSRACAPAPTRT